MNIIENDFNHLINYEYDTPQNLSPSGGTGASAIGVKRNKNIFVLNTESTSDAIVKIKLNGPIVRTNSNGTVQEWNGITLKTRHTYKISNIYLSGSSNGSTPNAISVYKEGEYTTIGFSETLPDRYVRTFIYDSSSPVNIVWVVQAGTTFDNYKSMIILEDITENVEHNLYVDNQKFDSVENIINYDYDRDEQFLPNSSAASDSVNRIGFTRHKTNMILNGGNVNKIVYIRLNSWTIRTTSTSAVQEWTGIALKNNVRYRVIFEKISGEVNGTPSVSVYKVGTSTTLGVSFRDGDRFVREFTAPPENVNIVLYIPSGITFTDAEYSIVLQECNDYETPKTNHFYSGEMINVNHKIACEKYMTISNEASSRQGATTYGNYLFVAYNSLPMISVYNFDERVHINNIEFTAVSGYHCNNINFGNEKYDSDDYFPLLYISMEHIDQHKCLVFRITEIDDVFSATLVQTITYPVPADVGMYYPNCFIDTINSFMYILGYTKDSYSTGEVRKYRIMGYDLPLLSDGDLTLDPVNAFQNFTVKALPTSVQGGFIIGDRLIRTFGNTSYSPTIYLMQLSLSAERFITKIKLNDVGITTEPESVFLYNENVYVFMQDRNIYKLYF